MKQQARFDERPAAVLTTRPVPGPVRAAGDQPVSRRAYFVLYACRSGTTELTGAIFIPCSPPPVRLPATLRKGQSSPPPQTRPIPVLCDRPVSQRAYFVLYTCRSGTTELTDAIFILLTSSRVGQPGGSPVGRMMEKSDRRVRRISVLSEKHRTRKPELAGDPSWKAFRRCADDQAGPRSCPSGRRPARIAACLLPLERLHERHDRIDGRNLHPAHLLPLSFPRQRDRHRPSGAVLERRSAVVLTIRPIPGPVRAAGARPLLRRAYFVFMTLRSGTTELTDAIFIPCSPPPVRLPATLREGRSQPSSTDDQDRPRSCYFCLKTFRSGAIESTSAIFILLTSSRVVSPANRQSEGWWRTSDRRARPAEQERIGRGARHRRNQIRLALFYFPRADDRGRSPSLRELPETGPSLSVPTSASRHSEAARPNQRARSSSLAHPLPLICPGLVPGRERGW